MDSWCIPKLTSGGVVLRESGDTSLTCGFPFVEGGYEDGRPMEMGAWLQLDVLLQKSEKEKHTIFNNEAGALGWQVETHQNVLLGSDTSWVWNFCICSSDVILHGNQWWSCKMLAVFLG